jgi:hypothetical protein
MLLISPWMQFWFVTVFLKYCNFATLSKDLFLNIMMNTVRKT